MIYIQGCSLLQMLSVEESISKNSQDCVMGLPVLLQRNSHICVFILLNFEKKKKRVCAHEPSPPNADVL